MCLVILLLNNNRIAYQGFVLLLNDTTWWQSLVFYCYLIIEALFWKIHSSTIRDNSEVYIGLRGRSCVSFRGCVMRCICLRYPFDNLVKSQSLPTRDLSTPKQTTTHLSQLGGLHTEEVLLTGYPTNDVIDRPWQETHTLHRLSYKHNPLLASTHEVSLGVKECTLLTSSRVSPRCHHRSTKIRTPHGFWEGLLQQCWYSLYFHHPVKCLMFQTNCNNCELCFHIPTPSQPSI